MAVLMGVLGMICMSESSKAKGALSVTMRKEDQIKEDQGFLRPAGNLA
jgi:hypothetical protein